MNAAVRWAGVAGLGAGLMYFLDPDRGRGRRSLVRDKGRRMINQSSRAAGKTWRDTSNRVQGVATAGRNAFRRREAARFEFMQENWSPAARALAGAAGAGLVGWALKSRSVPSLAAGLAGAALLTRAVTNRDIRSAVGLGTHRRGIDVQKTIQIEAPVDEVYRFWTQFENFPKFMRNIREVREIGSGRSRWVAAGPAGVPVSWEAETTERLQNRLIAWKSLPGSVVENAGIVRFEPHGDGTRVTVRMSYSPPAGELGHGVASLFHADARSQLEEDLGRLKSVVERARAQA